MLTLADDRTRAEILAVSLHEAGHAVVGCLFGCEIEHATIEIDDSALEWGHICYQPPKNPVRHVALLTAGFSAEYRGLRKFLSAHDNANDFRDIANVLSAAIPGEDQTQREPLYRRGIELGRKLVHQHWPAVKHVARRLRTRTTISGREIRQIVQKHRSPCHAL